MAEPVEMSTLYRDARQFLIELAANNDRDWFSRNKARYDTHLKRPAERLLAELGGTIAALAGSPVRGKLFRPHRDVRFSEDKEPYHTHLHLLWTAPDGRGWFFGLSPDYASAGAGMMVFLPEMLEHWYEAVAGAHGETLAASLDAGGWRLNPPDLKRVPPPYPPDHPREALLRRKGLIAWVDDLDAALLDDPRGALNEAFTGLSPVSGWLGDHVTG